MVSKKNSIDKTLKNVTATLGFEGLKPSDYAIELNKMLLEGKISSVDARAAILNKYSIKAKVDV